MTIRELYHGADGDNILGIIRERRMKPGRDRKIFFAEYQFERAFMHGGDRRRMMTFVAKVRVQMPPGVTVERDTTSGVPNTLVVVTNAPIPAEVLELYIRKQAGTSVQTIRGAPDILRFLQR
jgi:hypothetical protein